MKRQHALVLPSLWDPRGVLTGVNFSALEVLETQGPPGEVMMHKVLVLTHLKHFVMNFVLLNESLDSIISLHKVFVTVLLLT